jgi:hypothetical protein
MKIEPLPAPSRRLAHLAFTLALAVGAISALSAQSPAPASAAALDEGAAALLIDAPSDAAEGFAHALAQALARESALAGIAATVAGSPDSALAEPESARRVAASALARWVLVARCRIEGSRVLWRAAVYDGADGSLIGADAFSAYAGLSALPLIDRSAASAVQAAALGSRFSKRDAPIQRRLVFSSADEGASVLLGGVGPDALTLGLVADGALEAPYLPFRPEQRLLVGLAKDGYWPASIRIKAQDSEKPIRLRPLMRKTGSAFLASYGTGRLLGAAAGYRWYPLPDAVYLRAEDSIWAAYDFRPGSLPVIHDELRLGAGAYLFSPPGSRFRASAGLGISGIFTLLTAAGIDDPVGFDLCLEPFFLTLEWHRPTWALVLEQRFPYSLGIQSGFIPREWLSLGGNGPLFLSVGAMLKW